MDLVEYCLVVAYILHRGAPKFQFIFHQCKKHTECFANSISGTLNCCGKCFTHNFFLLLGGMLRTACVKYGREIPSCLNCIIQQRAPLFLFGSAYFNHGKHRNLANAI